MQHLEGEDKKLDIDAVEKQGEPARKQMTWSDYEARKNCIGGCVCLEWKETVLVLGKIEARL